MPEDKLNPQIRELEIGTRILRKVKIYPMSMANQLSLNDVITEAVGGFFQMEAGDDDQSVIAFVSFMLDLIKDNLERVVGFVTDDPPEEFIKDITNSQLVDVADVIYEMNYADLLKKGRSLFQKTRTEEASPSHTAKRSPRVARSTDTG